MINKCEIIKHDLKLHHFVCSCKKRTNDTHASFNTRHMLGQRENVCIINLSSAFI